MDARYYEERSLGKEVRRVRRNYNAEEMNALREQYTDAAVKLNEVAEQKAEAVRQFKAQMDEIQVQMTETLQEIENRFIEQDCNCYCVPNYDTGMLEYIDTRTLEVVDERRLRPNERPNTIKHTMVHNAANAS